MGSCRVDIDEVHMPVKVELVRRAPRGPQLIIGSTLLGLVLLCALVGWSGLLPSPNGIDVAHRFAHPQLAHPMGTDQFGRDVLVRVVSGAGTALLVGLLSVGLGLVAGLLMGGMAGYWGGWVDELIMRVVDGLMAVPGLISALAMVAVLGPGIGKVAIAIGLMGVPTFARLSRASFLKIREYPYIEAARASGASDLRIVLRHMLPNAMDSVVVQAGFAFAAAVLTEAALSYLGLGVQPPDPSWGRMLREAQGFMGVAPWAAIGPGIALAASILGANMLSEALGERGERVEL